MSDQPEIALTLHRIDIPFRLAFKHSAAERSVTQGVWVEARLGDSCGVGEGCPREYVTGETLDSAAHFFARQRDALRGAVTGVDELADWVSDHAQEIDANPAAWCAIELAILDLLAQREGVPVEALLSLATAGGSFRYTAVLGDSDRDTFRAIAGRYAAMGFHDFKLKLCGDIGRDRAKLASLAELGIEKFRLRVDANNLWHDEDRAARHLLALDQALLGVEEPLPAYEFEAMRRLCDKTGFPVVLDESCLRVEHLAAVEGDPQRWIINVRVSKMGGLLRSLEMVRGARAVGIPLIVGAQVGETSVLTRAGLVAAAAAGDGLLAHEGGFGTWLLESDVADPPLMFGNGGVLDASAYGLSTRPGWGITLAANTEILRPL